MRAAEYQREYWARPEMNGYQARRRAERREAFFAGKSCIDCGATKALELDHLDPATKVGSDVWLWSRERREAEIAKCVVRCAPCHWERHAIQRRRHGINAYNQRGCRCDVCRAAKAEARRRSQGPDLNRTGVSSFAGKRVATPPPGQEDAAGYTQLSLEEASTCGS